jgi:hypothetical protein
MIRRLSNTNHEDPDQQDVHAHIETFIQQLKSSGYDRKCAREAVVCGILGWKRKISRRIKEGKPFYRSAASTLKQRCKKKLLEKVTWYKNKRKREDNADVAPRERKKMRGDNPSKEMHKQEQDEKQETVKAVMFVPFTVGSELAKRLREAEAKLQEMTGYRLKIVERSGLKLEDLLHRADPWQGKDCGRDCLLCITKQKTGNNSTQDCSRRSLVYETWCMTCFDQDTEAAKIQAGDDKNKLKLLMEEIKMHKYIGETNRSIFERGWEHLNDFQNLSTQSHLLKHAVEIHGEEDFKKLQFGIKVIRYAKSSFERQIMESVEIQENRHHHLLNSRSEFNRCAVPRLMCKLGDKTFKKHEQEMELDMAREETQVYKIRELIKARNKERGQRLNRKAPAAKRRKLDNEMHEARQDQQELEKSSQEKRKSDESHETDTQPPKRMKTSDIRQFMQAERDKNTTSCLETPQEQFPEAEPAQETPPQEPHGVHLGEAIETELVDWESIFTQHLEETRRLEKEKQEKIELANKKEKSWEMLRECTSFLKQNEKTWKIDLEKPHLKKKQEDKQRRLELARIQKEETLMKVKQQKITSTWKLLPEHEKKKFLLEEETRRRMELREAKINLWKKWRHPNNHKQQEYEKTIQPGDRLLERLEQNIERMKKEVERRNESMAKAEERRKQLIAERKMKQEQLLRQEQEKQDKKVKKKMIEERWKMMKWLTKYIDENTDKWAKQKKEKEENEKKWLEDWARMTRLEKIRTIREKQPNLITLNVTVMPEKLKPTTTQPENQSVAQPSNPSEQTMEKEPAKPDLSYQSVAQPSPTTTQPENPSVAQPSNPSDQSAETELAEPDLSYQAERTPPQTETYYEEDQAEQYYPSQAEPCLTDQGAPLSKVRAEHHVITSPSPCSTNMTSQGTSPSRDRAEHPYITSSSSCSTKNIRQPTLNSGLSLGTCQTQF